MVSLRIALRYLFSRKSHHAVNLISRISVAGVAVATAAIVCVLSVFNGFSRLASERLSHIDPELRVEPLIGKSIGRADSLAGVLMATGVVEAVSPVIEERALAMYGGVQLPVRIKGVADGYEAVTDIKQHSDRRGVSDSRWRLWVCDSQCGHRDKPRGASRLL